MGVSKYVARKKTWWRVDTYVTLPDGTKKRLKCGRIPTREQAEAREHKLLAEAYEGRFFDRQKEPTATVRQLWAEYEPITRRDNDSWPARRGPIPGHAGPRGGALEAPPQLRRRLRPAHREPHRPREAPPGAEPG